jgi:hypothetical protein
MFESWRSFRNIDGCGRITPRFGTQPLLAPLWARDSPTPPYDQDQEIDDEHGLRLFADHYSASPRNQCRQYIVDALSRQLTPSDQTQRFWPAQWGNCLFQAKR